LSAKTPYLKAFSCFDLQKRIKISEKQKGQKKGKLVQTYEKQRK